MCVLLYWYLGLDGLTSRAGGQVQAQEGQILYLVVSKYMRPMVIFLGVVFCHLQLREYKRFRVGGLFSLAIGLLANLPWAVARFHALLVAVLLVSLVQRRFERLRGNIVWFLLLILGLFGSGLADQFRYASSLADVFANISSDDKAESDYFYEGHFDAFEVNMVAHKHTHKNGYAVGGVLSGAVLFFVPRAIWTSKPDASGVVLSRSEIGNNNENLSCPLPAEGWLDFGLCGVLLFGAGLGSILSRLDVWLRSNDFSTRYFVGVVAWGLMLFFLRGSLMTTLAFTVSMCAAALSAVLLASYRVGGDVD
jgi:hypothetical protein